jgi:hypothetical protein
VGKEAKTDQINSYGIRFGRKQLCTELVMRRWAEVGQFDWPTRANRCDVDVANTYQAADANQGFPSKKKQTRVVIFHLLSGGMCCKLDENQG